MSSFTYYSSIPQSTDVIANSQGQILTNFTSIGSWTAVDHYSFGTGKDGFHTHVTNPNQGTHPSTTSNPLIYGMQDAAGIGVIQYSRGPSNAVPTPITELQSPSTPIILAGGGTTNIVDLTGISRAIMTLYIYNDLNTDLILTEYILGYSVTGATTLTFTLIAGSVFTVQLSTKTLQIKNSGPNVSNLYWTLRFHRIQ